MGFSLVFSQAFGSLFGFLSNRFLDLGAVFCGILSSPLTRKEKTPWAELSEARFKGDREVCPRGGGLRVRRKSEPRGCRAW